MWLMSFRGDVVWGFGNAVRTVMNSLLLSVVGCKAPSFSLIMHSRLGTNRNKLSQVSILLNALR